MRTRRGTGAALFAGLAAAAMVVAGCTGTDADKSGGTRAPTVLVLANNDGGDLELVPAVQRFTDRLRELSGGSVTVRVQSNWTKDYDEAQLVRDVAAGKADLGWIGTRAVDTLGVDAFEPLHAPFLVTSYAAEAALVKDPLAGQLLATLKPLGVTGLALAADQLRIPAGITKPLLTPADFSGATFRTFKSKIQTDGIRALGAQPTSAPMQELLDGGRLSGFETMWSSYDSNNYWGVAPFVTANAVLWPRTLALFAGSAALEKLDPQVRGWIVQAGADASAWSAEHAGDAEARNVQEACEHGARVAVASPSQLTALRAAAEPVYAALRAQPAQRATLERLETLVRSAGPQPAPTVPAGCAYGSAYAPATPAPATELTGPGKPGALPQGVYRYTISMQRLRAAGAGDRDARNNAGVYTWTLRAGHWSNQLSPEDPSLPAATCEGWYDVGGATAAFTTTTKLDQGDCAPPTWIMRWSVKGSVLTWSNASVADYGLNVALVPWTKIG